MESSGASAQTGSDPATSFSASTVSGHRYYLALLAITGAGLLVRTYQLTRMGLWLDEGMSVGIARLGMRDFFLLAWHREINMVLYYGLLKAWMLVSTSEWWIHALSVVLGAAAIPILYAVGAALFDRRTGLIAALLLAVNVYHIRYSQEIRAYSLAVLLVSTASLLFITAVRRPTFRTWLLYAMAAALAAYAHVFALLTLIAQFASLLVLPRNMRPTKSLSALRAILYLLVPLAICMYAVGTVPVSWVPEPDLNRVELWWRLFAGGALCLQILFGLAFVGFIVTAFRTWQHERRSDASWRYALVMLWAVLPVVLSLLVSIRQPVFVPRYLFVCLPGLLLAVASAIGKLPMAAFRQGILAAIVLFSIRGTVTQFGVDRPRDDWRGLTNYVLAEARPDDAVMFYGGVGRMSFDYYRGQAGGKNEVPLVTQPARGDYQDFLPTPLAEVIPEWPENHDRIWLVLSYHSSRDGRRDFASQVMRAWCAHRYTLVGERHFEESIEVLLYSRPKQNNAAVTPGGNRSH